MAMLQSLTKRLGQRNVGPIERYTRRFLRFFPKGFKDPKYFAWERGYKWEAHTGFLDALNKKNFEQMLAGRKFAEIAATCLRLESRTNLLFSFEKMAIRDGVRTRKGAKIFSEGLFELLHGEGALEGRFDLWCDAIASLPRRQTRVLTHPIATVFPFIADPQRHIFLKPLVTKKAVQRLDLTFNYRPRPSWAVYAELLQLAEKLQNRLQHLKPLDMIDIQSFIWVTGSSEYE